MCRLFGMLSVRPKNARKYLIEDPCSLLVQSKVDPKRLQKDGWGIGYYKNGHATLIKSEKPIFEEYEHFSSIVDQAISTVIIAHIRHASNPRGLPREKIISKVSSQPFMYKNFIFAHNGVIRIPDEVADALGEWKSMIKGFNDSETYFWYIIKEIEKGSSFQEALKSFQETLINLWNKYHVKYPQFKGPYEGLNVIFSDGDKIYAYAKYTKNAESSKSICYKEQPSLQMSYIHTDEQLIISSEKTNQSQDWKPLSNGNLLTGWMSKGKIEIEIQKI